MNGISPVILNQHNWIEITGFWTALRYEAGDTLNARHVELSDGMLDASVTSQKWMVAEITKNWHPNTIRIKAIELR